MIMIRATGGKMLYWNGLRRDITHHQLVQVAYCRSHTPPTPILRHYTTTAATAKIKDEVVVPTEPPEDHNPPPPFLLLGPPEIYQPDFIAKHNHPPPGTGNPFIDALCKHKLKAMPEPEFSWTRGGGLFMMGRTENNSPTYLASGNPCLDFFFHVLPDTTPEVLRKRLSLAWDHDPLTALKLVCQLRGVRGTGKSDKEGFYTSALWLYENHPKTLAHNVDSIAEFGYFKDLPEILNRLVQGPDFKKPSKQRKEKYGQSKKTKRVKPKEEEEEEIKAKIEEARELRKLKFFTSAKRAVEAYNNDPLYRLLYDNVSDLFAQMMRTDLENLSSGKINEISLACKWCPSLYSSFDKSTLLCEGIAKRLFPREMDKEYQGIEEAHYAYRVRDRLRKDVLVPLRKALMLPEIYMSANKWCLLPYNRVASLAMKRYKECFLEHDGERFKQYLGDVKKGKSKIAAGALLPHEVIASLKDRDGGEVAELQWRRIVEDLSKEGKLNNCLAICDVSGSMYGTPMEVCIALGILVSDLCEEPWKGKVITFSNNPQLHLIQGDDLKSKARFVENMEWNMNTDFQKVFDQILLMAVKEKLSEEQMIKRLFVFSDMEFDQAATNSWETDYKVITRKFNEKGYSSVPEIVFWNLRDSASTPVLAKQKGVALVSGFSKNILKMFLRGGGIIDPEAIMEAAISGKEYSKLVLVD